MKPVVFLVGLYVAAIVLAGFLGVEGDLFPQLFTAAGGIAVLGAYFTQKLTG